jgi:Cu2+-containing amine oxidase
MRRITGILWKHYEFRNETFEVRRSRRLVISFFTTVGNYDYGFFWYFYQDGTIQLEVKLTGIIQTAAIASGKPYPWGGMVADRSRRSHPPALLQRPPAHDAGRRGQYGHRARVPAAAVGH